MQGATPSLSPFFFHPPIPERLKDLSVKNWSQLAGSGPVPWRQAPTLFNSSISQPDFLRRMPYEVDLSTSIDRLNTGPSLEKRKVEDFSDRSINGSLKLGAGDILENGNPGSDYFLDHSVCIKSIRTIFNTFLGPLGMFKKS